MTFSGKSVLVGCVLLTMLSARGAGAEPLTLASGARLVAMGGAVTVHFAGSDAAFDSFLFLSEPVERGPLFPNHSTPIGDSATLGTFERGEELIFGLHVVTTGDEFFTGPADRNADGVVHAAVVPFFGTQEIPTRGLLVGFEDLFTGGDADFNDFQVVVENVKVAGTPEPASLMLCGIGSAVIALRRKRRS